MTSSRRPLGIALFVLLGLTVSVSAWSAHWAWRDACGMGEAEPSLDVFVHKAAEAYARDGKLCGSSRLVSSEPYGEMEQLSNRRFAAIVAEEARDNVGFHCLGVTHAQVGYGEDGYVYQAAGDAFRVQAFRAYLYDPYGALPRWERRGRVVDGHVEIDPRLYRIDPGGPEFPGHPPNDRDTWDVDDP